MSRFRWAASWYGGELLAFLGRSRLQYRSGWLSLDVTEDQLKGAPTYKESERDTAYDRDYQTRSYD